MQSFLYSQRGAVGGVGNSGNPAAQGSQAGLIQPTSYTSQQFIIVESNFRVYAYTDSKIYHAILRLFMEENYQFPNLIVGILTRESLKEAFKKKITARQIMNFLEQHAHPECRKS